MTQLLPQSLVRVWREKRGWEGPYKLVAVDNEDCTVEIKSIHAVFRSTVVKPYYEDPTAESIRAEDLAIEKSQAAKATQYYTSREVLR
jgi:hypothetical protein